jgi:sulfotransferase
MTWMSRRMHFISGLPRAGSTLLASILRQNPRFHAEMSSPLAFLYLGLLERMSPKNDYHLAISDTQRLAMSRGMFSSFYEHISDDSVIFDTSRVWCVKLPELLRLYPDAKIICCVRPLNWVLDSFERLAQMSPFYCSKFFNFDPSGSVYSHVDMLMGGLGAVSAAYNALKGAYFSPHASHLVLINYESLAREPAQSIKRLYEVLGEVPFNHDFSAVRYSASEFDRSVGSPGLHEVSGPVKYVEREPVLPPDLFSKFADSAFWKEPRHSRRAALII